MQTIPLSPPFVTTAVKTVKNLVEFLNAYKGKHIVDLGSGDGRVVIELAKKGHIVDGFELKPELVSRANERIEELSLNQRAKNFEKDYWNEHLGKYGVIYIYGIPAIMGKLEQKLETELSRGTIVILNVYRLPHWKIKKTAGSLNIYQKT